MKKTYINPEMEIIKIASQTQMLAGSVGAREDGPGAGGDGDAGGAEANGTEFDW